MDLKSMTTEALDQLLKQLLSADIPDAGQVREVCAELRRRESAPAPVQLRAMWPEYMRIFYREPVLDPSTGIMLQPSCHGTNCPGLNHCCDECDYYLDCFPEYA